MILRQSERRLDIRLSITANTHWQNRRREFRYGKNRIRQLENCPGVGHQQVVDGDCKTYTIAIGMECENMIASVGKRYTACLSATTRLYEQVVIVLQGEGDLYVDGIPYRLSAGSWINIPPHSSTTAMCTARKCRS
jgi:mannose-6-phosphate isomerase-like protein (cupin superfamily)